MLCNVSQCAYERIYKPGNIPSLVMKLMNSLTHSCMHSLASFAILAFSGKAVFMIRATGAKFLMLASDIADMEVTDEDDDRAPLCLLDAGTEPSWSPSTLLTGIVDIRVSSK
jgi:hypothetical protein